MKRMRYLVLAALLGLGALSVLPRGHEQAQAILTLGGTNPIIDVSRYATVQEAIDAAPAGARLYFPSSAGPYQPTDTSGWQIRKDVEIFGDGPTVAENVCLQPYQGSKNGTVFQLRGGIGTTGGFYMHDILISNGSGTPGTGGLGDYIRLSAADTTLSNFRLERVRMNYAGRSAIYFPGNAYMVGISMRDVVIYGCGGHGMFVRLGALMDIAGCSFSSNNGMGAVLSACGNGVAIHGSNFESNGARLTTGLSITFPETFGPDYNAQLYLGNSDAAVMGCNIEDTFSQSVYGKNGITLNFSHGCFIGGNELDNSDTTYAGGTLTMANTIAINLLNSSQGNTIASNIIARFRYAVKLDSPNDHGNMILAQNNFVGVAGTGFVGIPDGSYNFAVINGIPDSLGYANNNSVGILLPPVRTALNAPHANDIGTAQLQSGLMVWGGRGGDSLFVRKSAAWAVH